MANRTSQRDEIVVRGELSDRFAGYVDGWT
jgi:hypothetical protein